MLYILYICMYIYIYIYIYLYILYICIYIYIDRYIYILFLFELIPIILFYIFHYIILYETVMRHDKTDAWRLCVTIRQTLKRDAQTRSCMTRARIRRASAARQFHMTLSYLAAGVWFPWSRACAIQHPDLISGNWNPQYEWMNVHTCYKLPKNPLFVPKSMNNCVDNSFES